MATIITSTRNDITVNGLRLPKFFVVNLGIEYNGKLPFELICFRSSDVKYKYPDLYDTTIAGEGFATTFTERTDIGLIVQNVYETLEDTNSPRITIYTLSGSGRPTGFNPNDLFKVNENGNPFRIVQVEPNRIRNAIDLVFDRIATTAEIEAIIDTNRKFFLQNGKADVLTHINKIHAVSF